MRKYWLFLAVILIVASAALSHPAETAQIVRGDVEKQRQIWESQHILDYRFSLQIGCQCGFTNQPYTMEVRDGKPTSAIDSLQNPISPADIDAPPHSVDWFYGLTSIDGLFDYIEQVSARADKVAVYYDPRGFPTIIWVDWMVGQPGDEITLHVRNFQALP